MTAQEYLNKYQGQSLLWAANKQREYLRGQCVQAVCFYVSDNGKPVIWADAYPWYSGGLFSDQYDRIANTTEAVPQPGDIIIWGPTLPGSGGAGHIAVVLSANFNSFVSVDQNWGGKTVHQVTHNYNYVVGWLRFKGAAAAQPQGDEMIANEDQARDAYALLRGTRDNLSQGELSATAGHRTWAGFAVDARPELAARNANLAAQAQHMTDMQNIINTQNATITDLNNKLADANTSGADKQKALDEAMVKLADSNAELTTLHDKVTDLQNAVPAEQVIDQSTTAPADGSSLSTRILALILKLIPGSKK